MTRFKQIQRYVKKHGCDDTAKAMLGKLLAKKGHNKGMARPMKSLQDDWHRCYDQSKCGEEDYIEYGIFEADGMTDEEIQEHVDDMRLEIHSPYDCTGKDFTVWIKWHRNPSGLVSVIHYIGLDV